MLRAGLAARCAWEHPALCIAGAPMVLVGNFKCALADQPNSAAHAWDGRTPRRGSDVAVAPKRTDCTAGWVGAPSIGHWGRRCTTSIPLGPAVLQRPAKLPQVAPSEDTFGLAYGVVQGGRAREERLAQAPLRLSIAHTRDSAHWHWRKCSRGMRTGRSAREHHRPLWRQNFRPAMRPSVRPCGATPSQLERVAETCAKMHVVEPSPSCSQGRLSLSGKPRGLRRRLWHAEQQGRTWIGSGVFASGCARGHRTWTVHTGESASDPAWTQTARRGGMMFNARIETERRVQAETTRLLEV